MVTQRKGCGFLIAALVLLLVGGGIAAVLGFGAFRTGKDFADDIGKGETFVSPATLTYNAEEASEVTIWIAGGDEADFGKMEFEVTDTADGISTKATKSSGTSNFGDQHLVAYFSAEKDKTYRVTSIGAPDGSTFRVTEISSTAVLSMLGQGFGAFGVVAITGILVLIFGIVGLVKFFGSKNAVPPAMPPAR